MQGFLFYNKEKVGEYKMIIRTRAFTRLHLLDLEDKNVEYNLDDFNNRSDVCLNLDYIISIAKDREFNVVVMYNNQEWYFKDEDFSIIDDYISMSMSEVRRLCQ